MIIYEQAEPLVFDLLKEVQAKYHTDLPEDLKVGILFIRKVNKDGEILPGAPIKNQGQACAARIKNVSLKDRIHKEIDIEIHIDAEAWKLTPYPVQVAILDHELEHIVDMEERDDLGRPKLKIRRDEFFTWGFFSIIQRHGENAPELQVFKKLSTRVNQIITNNQSDES